MKRNILHMIMILFAAFTLQAHENPVVDSANYYYQEGQYELAIQKYKSLVDSGYVAPELYYNLGNSYYRVEKYTHAILNYERAKLLDPNDEDIEFNLGLCYTKVSGKNEGAPVLAVDQWMKSIRSNKSSDTWAIFSLGSFIILLSLILVFLFTRRVLLKKVIFSIAVLALFISIFTLVFSLQRKSDITENEIAIISDPTVTVLSSPDANGVDVFVAYEGTKVIVTNETEGWREIKLPNGEVGWLPENSILEIEN